MGIFGLSSLVFGIFANVTLAQQGTIPNYPCYRTVESTFATAQQLVEQHPNLATWVDVGDSWEKTAGEGGHDMMVLKLTNKNITGDKPKLFATSAIHAREYATAELMTRFAEHLVQQYGQDSDITWMLDHHEAHFMLITNPDGRKKAEPNVMWRKNTNRNFCGRTSSNRGIDLNRNFDYYWGSAGSSSECSETFRGPYAASEPETQAVQNHLRANFEDRRGPNRDDPAPRDTSGVYLDIHSYGEIIYQSTGTPNDRDIITINRRLGYLNGYRPIISRNLADAHTKSIQLDTHAEDHVSLFNHTYDFAYGDLGMASFLIELGTTFFQSCSYFRDNIVPGNFAAIKYALRIARTPYLLAAGPDAVDIQVEKQPNGGVRVQATVTDERYSRRSGTAPTQAITGAQVYIDTPPWLAQATAIPMSAVDGRFDETAESVAADIDGSLLDTGRHTIFIQGKDREGVLGPVYSTFVDID